MITLPTTELIGGLNDVLPIITDPKSSLAGVVIEWTGDSLRFTAYDVFSGGSVEWIPGTGAEGSSDDEDAPDIDWGGNDDPWRTWIWLAQAKDVIKLFTLPAKFWRAPVSIKCTAVGDLIVERVDSPRGNRELRIPGDPDKARSDVPQVHEIARQIGQQGNQLLPGAAYNHQRLGAFGAVRLHGAMAMAFGQQGQATGVMIGTRYSGFIYPVGSPSVRPFNFLRDGSGVVTS